MPIFLVRSDNHSIELGANWMRWLGNVASGGAITDEYKILFEKVAKKGPF
jgi:hypothetical protein